MRDEIYCGDLISEDYLEHYGRAHDENPPGRGSGHYAYGSGSLFFKKNERSADRHLAERPLSRKR